MTRLTASVATILIVGCQPNEEAVPGQRGAAESGTASVASRCSGPVIAPSEVTEVPYEKGTVEDGTRFDLRGWYSNAVGHGSNHAFEVGGGNGPTDVCVEGGVINGHIDPALGWGAVHMFNGFGFEVHTRKVGLVKGGRLHNVEDGFRPREVRPFDNTASMRIKGVYMTAIRDDCIEDDQFMPGVIEDSLFDGVWTFLSEQNQSGGTPMTISPEEDHFIRVTGVLVRLYTTNGGETGPGRWMKFMDRGTANHTLVITDSVFALDSKPREGWDVLEFPQGTEWHGTNVILWLGTPGQYKGPHPDGVMVFERPDALERWNRARNGWLLAHGYDPRPEDDLDPMDDPVLPPR